MSLDHLPANIEENVQRFADELHISHDEALLQLIQTGLSASRPYSTPPTRSYASFFGIAKGRPSAHGSAEEADRYIEDLRNAW